MGADHVLVVDDDLQRAVVADALESEGHDVGVAAAPRRHRDLQAVGAREEAFAPRTARSRTAAAGAPTA